MFTSNQKFTVSGEMEFLTQDICHAMQKSGEAKLFTRKNNPCICGYQITENGLYVIGNCGLTDPPRDLRIDKTAYTPYQFDYDPEIIAKIVRQWLAKQTYPKSEFDGHDGGHEKGYLMQTPWELKYEVREKIKDIHSAIICIAPYKNYYAK